jgi:hypothetical protein
MILRPALRFATRPFPPADFAARRLAAVILPPLLFFAMCEISFLVIQVPFHLKPIPTCYRMLRFTPNRHRSEG